jgi:Protein of unknown function (DUF1524)
VIQYTLSKIDKHHNESGTSINYDLMTLEHILPQKGSSQILNHKEVSSQIGNLILIDEKTNNLLATKPFLTKKAILQGCNIYCDNKLTNVNEWTEKEIEDRTLHLAYLAYNSVFKI